METKRLRRSGLGIVRVVTAAVVLLAAITAAGCAVEPEKEPAGEVSVEDTLVGDLGTCQVVLSVSNVGDVEINEIDLVFSITTDGRRYYHRVVEGGSIPPGKTAGFVEEITLDSAEEAVDPEATAVEWEVFS